MPRSSGRPIVVARRILAAVFALCWLTFPGFGLPDLLVTWTPGWAQVLEAGWGLYMTVLLALPFALTAASARFTRAAAWQLTVGAGALGLASVVTMEWRLGLLAALVALELLVAVGRPRWVRPARIDPGLLVLAGAGVALWGWYTARQWHRDAWHRPDADVTLGIDHVSVQGALGVAVVLLVLGAASWPWARRQFGLCAAVSAGYLGLVTIAWPHSPGAAPVSWAALVVGWAIAVAGFALRPPSDPSQMGDQR